MFHLLAFTVNQADGAVNTDCPGVTDGYAPLLNGHYLLPWDFKVLAAIGMGSAILRARINMPTMRNPGLPSIFPLEQSATVTDWPALVDYGDFGPNGGKNDEIAIDTTNTAGAANRHIAGLWVAPLQFNPAPPGPSFALRFTAANTGGNLAWGASGITFEQNLPAGRYRVVGLDVLGANLVFARLRFQEGGMLPGVLARPAINLTPVNKFRQGRTGVFGEFDNCAPPSLEIFGTAAGTTQEGVMDVVKIR